MLKVIIDKKVYPNGYQALEHLRLDIPTSGLYAIIGESGSGKSTLLNCISGIDDFDGQLIYNGNIIRSAKEIEYYRKHIISTIFQDFRLLEELSVGENIALASDIIGKPLDDVELDRLLGVVGLANGYKTKKINELSYGEMQRIAIARAIAKNSKIIVADEPTANLDSQNAHNIMSVLKDISKEKLVLVVTHNTALVEKYFAGYVELSDGEVVKNTISADTAKQMKNETTQLTDENRSVSNGGKIKFSLLGKLIKSQRKNNRKNIALVVVTLLMLFLSTMSIIFGQVDILSATKYTLRANEKGDRTVYADFVDMESDGCTSISSDNLGEYIAYSYYLNSSSNDIFNSSEFNTYLTTIKDEQIFYGNNYMSFNRVVFADNLVGTGLQLVTGKNNVKDNEVIISSAIADIIIVLGNTPQSFVTQKSINSYDDLLGLEFSLNRLIDGKSVKIVGVYKSSENQVKTYGQYTKLNNDKKYRYNQKVYNTIHIFNSIVMSKSNIGDTVDGIVINDVAKKMPKINGISYRLNFIGHEGLLVAVNYIVQAKYYVIIPLAIIFNLLVVLTVYIAMSGTISRNKEQILTLRALGMSHSGVTKIYLLSTVILTAVELILMTVFTLIGVPIANAIISSFNPDSVFTILGINAWSLLIPMLVLICSNILITYVSILKLFRKSVETNMKEK